MRVFLTGGTGFIGSRVVNALAARGDDCVVLSRAGRDPWHHERVRVVRGNPTEPGDWHHEVASADFVVNLAGHRIVEPPHRWTEARKQLISKSRTEATRQCVAAIRAAATAPRALISASAIGYCGDRGAEVIHEATPPGDDFLARLSVEWEGAAREAEAHTRVTLLRTGLVLDPKDGALAPLVPLFKLGLGGPWGSGEQWWSWIHVADQIGLILFAIDNDIPGPLNLTAPNPVTVNEFAKALGAALNRPALLRVPEFALRLMLGEMADSLLGSLRVVPQRALETGYKFQFPELDGALADLFRA